MRMSLDNLVKTNQLARHTPRPVEVQRLLAAAERNLADARIFHITRAEALLAHTQDWLARHRPDLLLQDG
jgi:hypothetical protein